MQGMIVLGTRPELVKILPIINELIKERINFKILDTNQHQDLLDDVLLERGIVVDYKLKKCNYDDLFFKKAKMLEQISQIISVKEYVFVLVQGDTLSSLVGAEFGFFNKIPVYHVEAGMRTYNNFNPYPEEIFRRIISLYASKHFCPTEKEMHNLLLEGIKLENIYVVGNTYVDFRLRETKTELVENKNQVLITIHRRENLEYLDNIFSVIKELALKMPDTTWLFPIHPNSIIVDKANILLDDIPNIKLIKPLLTNEFYNELLASKMVITDSGGVQEECILALKKVLVVRECTERETDFNFISIVSPKDKNIKEKFIALFNANVKYNQNDKYCYGYGNAASQIVNIIKED